MFDLYAAYYDLLYRDKDYAAESEYVRSTVVGSLPQARTILELGCGTGGHAQVLAANGFRVLGVDLSSMMIERALERRNDLPKGVAGLLAFRHADIRSVRVGETFDAVVSLFHVMSYQTTNSDQEAAFATARAHLARGGLFVFDFWYGPAVLSDLPRHVMKKVADERIEVCREATPTMHVNDNCVEVRFDVDITVRQGGRSERLMEKHLMRYLFLPEIEQRLGANGFRLLAATKWLSREPLSTSSWYGCVVAQVT